MVGVLTVDDHAAFHAAARDVVDATPGFEPAGEATSGTEALALVSRVRAGLALVDVRMHGMDGVETARLLRAADPALVVVLVSVYGGEGVVRKQDLCPSLLRELWATHGHEQADRSITRDG